MSAGTGLFSGGKSAFGQEFALGQNSGGGLTRGDVAILRFLVAAELIESDLWTQYAELGGIGNNPPIEVDPNQQLNAYHLEVGNRNRSIGWVSLRLPEPWTEIHESQGGFNGDYFVGYDRDKSQFLMIGADDPASVAYFTEGWNCAIETPSPQFHCPPKSNPSGGGSVRST